MKLYTFLTFIALFAVFSAVTGCQPPRKRRPKPTPPPKQKQEPDPTEPDLSKPASEENNLPSEQPQNPNNPDGSADGEPGVAENPDDLKCSASDDKCCWANEQVGDTIDWSKGKKLKPSVVKFLEFIKQNVPESMKTGPFFYVGKSGDGSKPSQMAWFKSCSIPCLDPGATVSISKVMAYNDAQIIVCVIGSGSSGPPEKCSELKISGESGKATLDLQNPVSDVQIIIEAEGFSKSGLVAMDGISVQYTGNECPTETDEEGVTTDMPTTEGDAGTTDMDATTEDSQTETPIPDWEDLTDNLPSTDTEEEEESEIQPEVTTRATTTTRARTTTRPRTTTESQVDIIADADAQNCAALKCDKQDCYNFPAPLRLKGYRKPRRADWSTHFPGDTDSTNAGMHNMLTGVVHENRDYRGCYLLPGRGSVQASQLLNVLEDRILQFEVFERTSGIVVKACTDKNYFNCPFQTNSRPRLSNSNWIKGTIRVPKGTENVYFVAQNDGRNQGAVGLRNLKWFKPGDLNNPDSTKKGKNVCKGSEQSKKIRDAIRMAKVGRAKAAKKAAKRKGRRGQRGRN